MPAKEGSELMRKRLLGAGAACVAGLAVAAPPSQQAAVASTATLFGVACDGVQSWTFSTPLTLGFTASGTISETWDTPDQCNDVGVFETALGQVPQVSWVELSGSNPATDVYSGSCVVATVTLGDTGESALLLGGVVSVSRDTSAPGQTQAEVVVLATTAPCNETSASGADSEVRTYTVLGK